MFAFAPSLVVIMRVPDSISASAFTAKVKKMIGGAAPVLESDLSPSSNSISSPSSFAESLLVVEYPGPSLNADHIPCAAAPAAIYLDDSSSSLSSLSSSSSSYSKRSNNNVNMNTNNQSCGAVAFDRGHRHWSSMLWLYPGIFMPFSASEDTDNEEKRDGNGRSDLLHAAARNTLRMKSAAGGGHTGWSALWGSCLHSRTGDSSSAWSLLKRAVQRYTAPNLLGLHPPLAKLGGADNCETCFFDAALPQDYRKEFDVLSKRPPPPNSVGPDKSTQQQQQQLSKAMAQKMEKIRRVQQRTTAAGDSIKQNVWADVGVGVKPTGIPPLFSSLGSGQERGLVMPDGSKVTIDQKHCIRFLHLNF